MTVIPSVTAILSLSGDDMHCQLVLTQTQGGGGDFL